MPSARQQYFSFAFMMVLFPALCLAQSNVAPSRVLRPVDMQHLVTLRGNVHPRALPQFDQGPAPDDLPAEHMLLVLQRSPDQETSLRALLDQQQVASASQFHQWLTPQQFGREFGPSDSDLQAVTGWLASQGFKIDSVAAGRTIVEFSGTAGQVRQALGTEIHKFHVNGADRWANASDPSIPAALAPVVAGIASLNNFPRKPLYVREPRRSAPSALAKMLPLFSYPGTCSDGSQGCYYLTMGPGDFAKIYGMYSIWSAATPVDGTGVTIAVVGETNIKPGDVADFRSMFDLPANAPNVILNGPDPGILTNGEEIESDLDVEWSGGVAKGATVDFVVSESTETSAGIDLSALYIVDNDLAPILSESYGVCEQELGVAGNAFYNTLWEQAAAEGITVVLGAGDSGSAGCDSANSGEIAALNGLGVSGFASTPFNIAVGGTDFNLTAANVSTYWLATNGTYQASALSYIPETTWNYSCASSGSLTGCTPPPNSDYLNEGVYLAAGSGGVSQVYSKPSWQTGTGVPADGARDIPDISLVGSEYYVICDTDLDLALGGNGTSCDLGSPYSDFAVVSGTSASAQAFAGVMAMVVQQHGRQGNANYVFYPLAAGANSCASNASAPSNSSCIFYDTQVGNNSVICAGGSPNCSNAVPGQYGIMVSKGAAAYSTTAGYDLATGLGSVNVANLVKNWKSNFTPSTTSLSLSTSPTTNPIQLVHGQSVNFNVSVGASSGTPSGNVSLIAQAGPSASGLTAIGPFTLSSGSASGSTDMLPGGSYIVTAHYAGNGTFGSSDSSPGIPVTVTKENSKAQVQLIAYDPNSGIITTDPASVTYGSLYLMRMNVTNSSGNLCANESTGAISYPCPSGALTLNPVPTDLSAPASSVAGQYTLNNFGYAEDQYIEQPGGTYSFTANYAGDSSYNSSASPPFSVNIALAPTSLTLSNYEGGSTITAGDFADLSATLTTQSYGATPTGTIQYYKNGSAWFVTNSLRTVTSLGAHGPVYDVEASLPVGATVITAAYSGDSNYAATTAAPFTVTVTDFSLTANPPTLNISAPGQSGSTSVSVAPLSGFTGTVNLSVLSGCPTGATCTLTTPSVNLTGASPVAETLTITTTASSATPPLVGTMPQAGPRFPVALIELLGTGLMLILLSFVGNKKWRPAIVIAGTGAFIACVWIACGGGTGGSQSPPASAPAVSLSPASLTFNAQQVGTTSAAQSITLTNTGNASLTIASMSLGGANQNDFSQTSNCSGTLTSNTSCAISVKFSPSGQGTRTGSLSIADNASGSPHIATLTGTGSEPPTPAGTYPVTLQATSGDDTHNLTVNVVVQ